MTLNEALQNGKIVAEDEGLGMIVVWNHRNIYTVYDVWDQNNLLEVDNFSCHARDLVMVRQVAQDYLYDLAEELAA